MVYRRSSWEASIVLANRRQSGVKLASNADRRAVLILVGTLAGELALAMST